MGVQQLSRTERFVDPGAKSRRLRSTRVIYGVVLILIAGVGALLLTEFVKQLRFTEKERQGVAYLTALYPLLKDIPDHRGLCTVDRTGKNAARDRCIEVERSVDDEFRHLAQVDGDLGKVLETSGRVDALQTRWQRLKKYPLDLPVNGVFAERTALVSEVVALIQYVAANSNLTLDPEADTYYLMDIAVNRLPQAIDDIALIRNMGSNARAAGVLDEPTMRALTVLVAQVRRGHEELQSDAVRIAAQPGSQTDTLETLAGEAAARATGFIDLEVNQLLSAQADGADAARFFEAGNHVLAAEFQLFSAVLARLDALLKQRVIQLQGMLYLSIVLLALALVLGRFLCKRLFTLLQRLEVSETHLVSIFKTVPDGIIVLDKSGLIGDFNPAAERIFGYRHDEVIGRNVSLLMPDPDNSRPDAYLRRYLEAGRENIMGKVWETQGRRKDGSVFPLELGMNAAVVDDRTMFTGIARDISQRKQAEREFLENRRVEQELRESRQQIRDFAAYTESIREEERVRIAHELHDELGQRLTALRMEVALLRIKYAEAEPSLLPDIKLMNHHIDEMVTEVRDISSRLWPSVLEHGLIPAAEWLLERTCKRAGLLYSLHFSEGESFDLPIEMTTTIFRMLQGSLTNVVRHAEAKRVDVTIAKRGNALSLVIQDDGKGFDLQAAGNKETFGLMSLRERAIRWGGSVLIDTAPGRGVRLEISMPLSREHT